MSSAPPVPPAPSSGVSAVAANDEVLAAHNRLLAAVRREGADREALATEYAALVAGAPDRYDVWANYSTFLYAAGRFAEAAEQARRSIAVKPAAEGHYNLGAALRAQGQLDEAIENLKKSINMKPEFAVAHYAAAQCYGAQGRYEYAADHLQVALQLKPEMTVWWLALSQARFRLGRYREALSAARAARALGDAEPRVLWARYSDCFKTWLDYDINRQLVDEVTMCLTAGAASPDKFGEICRKLFLHQPVIKAWQEGAPGLPHADIETLLEDRSLNWGVLNHPLFVTMLKRLKIHSRDLELFFTALRARALAWTVEGAVESRMWDRPVICLAALACQCFLNEYVFFESAEDRAAVATLAARIGKAVDDGAAPDIYDVTMLACYRPLHEFPFAENLLPLARDEALADMIRMQVEEPLQEREIKKGIAVLTSIDDSVSQLVKRQYEENPYPRWIGTGQNELLPLGAVLRYLFPYLEEDIYTSLPEGRVQTLVAGCGTGHQVVAAARLFRDTDMLAVDLSASSIAYAIRKTREAGVEGVEYGIADILKLRELGRQFDVIHCGGVLHHMQDPMAGWRVLNDCLKPGGFMLIGLYSEIARRAMVAARDFIRQNKFDTSPDGIRACREVLKILPPAHPAAKVTEVMDFYSLSMCRDLIFHVQEHRFTALQLRESIKALGLRFLGFDLPHAQNTLKSYREMFPMDQNALDLSNWHKYEQAHPDTFLSMYQFWLHKPRGV